MTGSLLRGVAATALLGATVFFSGCASQDLTRPSASGTATTSSSGAVTLPAATTPAASATGVSSPTPTTTSSSSSTGVDLRGADVGLVKGYDARAGVLSIDEVEILSGEEAVAHLAERRELWRYLECDFGPYTGGSTSECSIPNDYYVVNEDPRLRSLPLAPQARITLIPWPNCCVAVSTTRAELAGRAEGELPLLIRYDLDARGQITEVSEVYTP